MKKRSISKGILSGLVAVFLQAFLVLPTIAQEEDPFDHISLRLFTNTEYNDNLFLTRGQKASDLLFSIAPDLTLNLFTRLAEVSLAYQPRFVLPVENFNDTDVRRILHRGTLEIVSELTPSLQISLLDELVAMPTSLGTPDNNDPSLVQTNRVTFEPMLLMELAGRTDLEFRVFGSRFDSEVDAANRTDAGGRLRMVRQFHPRLTIGVRGEGEIRLFDSATIEDILVYGTQVEFISELTPLLKLEGRAGVQWLRFDSGGTKQDISANALLEYQVSNRGTAKFIYGLGYFTDVDGQQLRLQQYSFEGAYEITPLLSIKLLAGYREFEQVFANPITGTVGPTEDTLLSIRPSLWYNLHDRLEVEAGYSWSTNRGGNSINDFDQNIVFLRATYLFKEWLL